MIETLLASLFFIGDSHTFPVVGTEGPGYTEIVDAEIGADWFGCSGGTLAHLDTAQCSIFPGQRDTLPEGQTYLRDVVGPIVEDHETVYLLFGTNDLIFEAQTTGIDVQTFADNLVDAGLYLVEERGVARVVVLGAPDREMHLPGPYSPYFLSRPVQDACAAIEWLDCGPNFQDVIRAVHYEGTPAGLHPNAEGHAAMAEAVIAYVPEPGSFAMGVAALGTTWAVTWRRLRF